MLITEKQAQDRLSSPNNLANRFSGNTRLAPVEPSVGTNVQESSQESNPEPEISPEQAQETTQDQVTIIPKPHPGKRTELSHETRTTIAILSRGTQTQSEIAAQFGTSQAEVSNLKIGKVKSGVDQERVEAALSKVRDAALDKLMLSMGLISQDKLSSCSAPQLSIVAANMSRVVEKTFPKQENNAPTLQLVIHAPQVRQETSYRTLEVD